MQLTEENYQQICAQKDKTVLIDFYATWCMPCKMIAPIIEEIEEENGDTLIVAKCNVDEQPAIAAEYKVRSIPTLVVLKNGEVAEVSVGVIDKDEILELLS